MAGFRRGVCIHLGSRKRPMAQIGRAARAAFSPIFKTLRTAVLQHDNQSTLWAQPYPLVKYPQVRSPHKCVPRCLCFSSYVDIRIAHMIPHICSLSSRTIHDLPIRTKRTGSSDVDGDDGGNVADNDTSVGAASFGISLFVHANPACGWEAPQPCFSCIVHNLSGGIIQELPK